MATTGQTINDRLNAVRYALVGQGLARTVCKATTEEILGPKKKHIDYLLACTNEPNVSTPQLANLLIERTQNTSWAVVFKALISIHHLMSFGNERFTQYLATSNHSFELADFMDRTTPQGYGMSSFVRNYAKYINDKVISYRTLAIDLCKIKSGNDNALRTMNMDNLGKTLPVVKRQFDALLDFAAEPKDLSNGIIMAAFRLLYKDLVRLYVAYQEAIINLLERYFKLSRRKTREALEMYKSYLSRMDKVASFLRVVEAVGLDKSEMPDLTKSPASILKLLEQHLAQLEAKKKGTTAASPEPEEGDDISQNRENKDPSSTTIGEEQPSDPRQPKEQASTSMAVQAKPVIEAPNESLHISPAKVDVAPKKASPPARPVASPKLPPATAVSEQSTTPASGSTGEKKASPPERPAKPPLRPPPPSAAAAAAAAQTASSSATSSPASSSSKHHQPAATAQVASASSPTPPPHPPPPEAHTASSSASAVAAQSTTPEPSSSPQQSRPPRPTTAITATTTPQQVASADDAPDCAPASVSAVENHGAANHSPPGDDAPPPNGAASSDTDAIGCGQQSGVANVETDATIATNHVDVADNNHPVGFDEANDMPPPPPPIDDEHFDNHQVAADVDPQRQQQEPHEVAQQEQAPVNGGDEVDNA